MDLLRRRTSELMDDPSLDADEHRRALRGLARLNRVASVDRVIWGEVGTLARRAAAQGRALRFLDVATGSGDLPIALARRAAREGVMLEWHACDISERALACAVKSAADGGVTLHTLRLNVLKEALPEGFDVVHCGLFLHHFDPPEVEQILRRMGAAGRAVVVQDLRRSHLGLAMAWAVPRLMTRSTIVHIDAVQSVRAAFTVEEMKEMAHRAGLAGARVRPVRPERQLLVWHRES